MDFRVLHHSADPATLQNMADEMDRAMTQTQPDLGRQQTSATLSRYRIHTQSLLYPTAHSWAHSVLNTLPAATMSFMAYVRQTRPTGVHIDHSLNMGPGHTVILPLRHCADVDSTIVFAVDGRGSDSTQSWQERSVELSREWMPQPLVQDDSVPHQDLAHCAPWVRHLPILGRFHYRLGDAVLFHGHLLHCSNCWSSNTQRSHRDYLLIHTKTADSLNYSAEVYS